MKLKKMGLLLIVAIVVVIVATIIVKTILGGSKVSETKDIYLASEEITYDVNGNETMTVTYTYEQNSSGIKGTGERRIEGNFDAYIEADYDIYGRKTSVKEYSTGYVDDNYLKSEEYYTYAKDGSFTKNVRYLSGLVQLEQLIEYDKNGDMIKRQDYDKNTDETTEYEYKYSNEDGKRIMECSVNGEEYDIISKRIYDEEGRMKEVDTTAFKMFYEYDKAGNMTRSKKVETGSEAGSTTEYQYQLFQVKNPEYYIK